MLEPKGFSISRAKRIITEYESGAGSPEQISKKYRYDEFEVFTIIYNYRFCFKKSSELKKNEQAI